MKRVTWILAAIVLAGTGVGWWTVHQQRLGRQLLETARQDPAEVAALLDAGADPNVQDVDGATAVLIAAGSRKPEIVSLLADRGADLHRKDGNGRTSLHRAAAVGDDATLQVLAEHGHALDVRDRGERTALMLAVSAGFPQAVRVLLEAGADPNLQDREGQSALIIAAGAGLPQVCAQLLEQGAEVDLKDELGRTALIRALQLPENTVTPQSFMSSTVSLPSGEPLQALSRPGTSRTGSEPRAFSRDVVAQLLKSTVDVKVQDGQGRGVLDLAVGRLPGQQVDELRRRGARCSADTDLLLATALDRPAAAQQALAAGAGVDSRDAAGRSALWWAVTRGSPGIAERLLKQGADPDGSIEPPLVRAIRNKNVELVRLLLRYRASTRGNGKDATPLMLAVGTQNTDVIRALLEAGAEVNATRSDGETALHEAVMCGKAEPVQTLLDAGADPNARLWERTAPRTVLGRACIQGQAEIAALLYRRGARLTGESEDWMEHAQRMADAVRGKSRPADNTSAVVRFSNPAQLLKTAELLLHYQTGRSP